MTPSEPQCDTAGTAAPGHRRFALYMGSRVLLFVALQMLSVAVGWQLYEITGKALALGLSGLAVFLPRMLFALPGGHLADHRDRRTILLVGHVGVSLCAIALALIAHEPTRAMIVGSAQEDAIVPIYAVITVLGAIRTFIGPASTALLPTLVPSEHLPRAVAFGSSSSQLAAVVGPSIGGALFAATGGAMFVYLAAAVMAFSAWGALALMGETPSSANLTKREPARWSKLLEGLRYVRSQRELVGAISLDLFAVLLGGSQALLPIFARDLLHIGPWGLGLLRAGPAAGAACVALLLTCFPLKRRVGAVMLIGIMLFGLATIALSLSQSFLMAAIALVVLGASDMISVVVRSTLVLMRTPDEMRGRAGAVMMVFGGASNELGEFESGMTAAWLGTRTAVMVGGVGTCLVAGVWAMLFPALRKVDRVDA
jgi:MFS family permease